MKAVMLSIRPEWCEMIASGRKTIEVRKTRPAIRAPFKCYIYCTSGSGHEGLIVNRFGAKLIACENWRTAILVGGVIGNGKVIAEFTCDWCDPYDTNKAGAMAELVLESLVPPVELLEYMGSRSVLYGWHISDLVIYAEPRELNEFMKRPCDYAGSCGACNHAEFDENGIFADCELYLKRPPQSWCYVEELGA